MASDRELDAWLAVNLFGLVPCTSKMAHGGGEGSWLGVNCHASPDSPDQGGEDALYSSTGDGMLLVLDAMRGRGFQFELVNAEGGYLAMFGTQEDFDWLDPDFYSRTSAIAPQAVAEAAQVAIEAEALVAATPPVGETEQS